MTTTASPAARLLTPQEAADHLGVTKKALENWRGAGTGPDYVKMGKYVKYTAADLDAFIHASRRQNTAH